MNTHAVYGHSNTLKFSTRAMYTIIYFQLQFTFCYFSLDSKYDILFNISLFNSGRVLRDTSQRS